MKSETLECIILVIAEILCVIVIMRCCCACTPKSVIVEKVTHDTLTVQKLQRDSIYLHDSIFTTIFGRNDTIFQTTYKLQNRWRERITRDTVRIVKRDSIPVPVTEIKEVKTNVLKWWQKVLMNIGAIALIAVVLLTWLRLRKK